MSAIGSKRLQWKPFLPVVAVTQRTLQAGIDIHTQ